jgi:hypothetical protein
MADHCYIFPVFAHFAGAKRCDRDTALDLSVQCTLFIPKSSNVIYDNYISSTIRSRESVLSVLLAGNVGVIQKNFLDES